MLKGKTIEFEIKNNDVLLEKLIKNIEIDQKQEEKYSFSLFL